jgi:hypothetical protein
MALAVVESVLVVARRLPSASRIFARRPYNLGSENCPIFEHFP